MRWWRPDGILYYDWAVIALLRQSPTSSALSAALAEESVWPSGVRSTTMRDMGTLWDRVRSNASYRQVDPAAIGGLKGGVSFSWLVNEAQARAKSEGAPELREWHIASVMASNGKAGLRAMGIDLGTLVRRVGEIEGRITLRAADLAKAWCFADANVFLEYQHFYQVDWPRALGVGPVVLVVPTSVLRALDRYKSDFERQRLHRRARGVLPHLSKYALAVPPGEVAEVRTGVGLLLRDREPAIPKGLDPLDQDDRIIADVLDFKWARPGARVVSCPATTPCG